MNLRVLLGLIAVLLLVVACAPIPQSAPPTTAPTPVPVAPSPGPTLASVATAVAPQRAASGWQTYWRVTLPKIKWGLLYGVILCNARAMGEFGAVYVVSGHIAGRPHV